MDHILIVSVDLEREEENKPVNDSALEAKGLNPEHLLCDVLSSVVKSCLYPPGRFFCISLQWEARHLQSCLNEERVGGQDGRAKPPLSVPRTRPAAGSQTQCMLGKPLVVPSAWPRSLT